MDHKQNGEKIHIAQRLQQQNTSVVGKEHLVRKSDLYYIIFIVKKFLSMDIVQNVIFLVGKLYIPINF